jgi:hypothetical protein
MYTVPPTMMGPRTNGTRRSDPFKVAAIVTLALFVFQLALGRLAKKSSAWTHQPHHPLSGPIWIMGLPRSGSLALHEYFTCHGKSSSHYCCGEAEDAPTSPTSSSTKFPCKNDSPTCGDCVLQNFKSKQPPFQGCGKYDVFTQFDVETQDPYAWFLPQHFALPLLHQAYPNATFVLNTRSDPSTWAKSVLHWYSLTRRLFHAFDLEYYATPPPLPPDAKARVSHEEIVQDMQRSLDERILNATDLFRQQGLLEQVYTQHLIKIRQWMYAFPSHALVEINVDAPDEATRILDQAFGFSSSHDDNNNNKCKFSFNGKNHDNDWKDFSLPF